LESSTPSENSEAEKVSEVISPFDAVSEPDSRQP